MARSVRLTLLCEDKQHKVFAHRFFKSMGWNLRDWRTIVSPAGQGSGEQFVRTEFPKQLRALRGRGNEQVFLVVLIDGNTAGARRRRQQIDEACIVEETQPPSNSERVMIGAPTRSIETWIASLAGTTVNETSRNYPKLTGRESECQPQVEELARMCERGELSEPAPPSLIAACEEYRRVFG